eukprot:Opistho-2@9129
MGKDVVTEEDKAQAEAFKEKGNKLFQERRFDKAVEEYTKAIIVNPDIPAYYANRAFAYIKVESYGYALEDSSKAIDMDKTYIKAYYRRASANMALGKFKESLRDLKTVVKFAPNDHDANIKLKECEKIVKRIAFEKAIATEDKKTSIDPMEIEAMAVESDYDGPHLGENITVEFVTGLLEHYRREKKLHRKYAFKILIKARELMMNLPSLVDVSFPEGGKFTLCGDIHGQFYDLLNIFKINGLPSKENPYMFNGDFVDRGSFSVECIFTLLSFKLLYPNHFFMNRGNHESDNMNKMYGFDGETKHKYNEKMVSIFHEVFNWLPLAHCINKRVLVMHGGLFSDDNVVLDDIRRFDRFREPPESGIMCELLWSDPQPQLGRAPSKRGVGIHFGPDITKRFCEKNGLDYIVRSHEVKDKGYEEAHDGRCITVFSAPNYCDQMGNKGAFITMTSDMKPNFTSFDAVPHPNVRPMAYAGNFGMFM